MRIVYNLDEVSPNKIEGWAWLEGDEHPVTIEFYDTDDKLNISLQAAIFRKDLADAGIGNGCHSFFKDIDTSNISCIKLVHRQADTIIIEINEKQKKIEIEFDKVTIERALSTLESKLPNITPEDISSIFRTVPLDVFAKLQLSIPTAFPKVKNFLPTVPISYIQNAWTGSSGLTLLHSSCAFIRSLTSLYERLTRKKLFDSYVLDYGCGWGRLSRLLLKDIPINHMFAADAWQKSIDIFLSSRIHNNVKLVDEYPTGSVYDDIKMDLIFAFSVFTHTSPLCTSHILSSLRETISSDGILVITVRPENYWKHQKEINQTLCEKLVLMHRNTGYAFYPHNRPSRSLNNIEDIAYGDSSISLDYISKLPQWEIAALDYNFVDPFKTIVALKPC